MTTVLMPCATEALARRQDLSIAKGAQRLRAVKIACAVLLGVAFWFAVPYGVPLKVNPDPITAAATEAAAYEGNLSREIAMPVILVIVAYMLWRVPKRGRIAQGSLLTNLALCYVGWAVSSCCWSVDPGITHKRLIVFLVDVLFTFALARCASVLEIALFGFSATGMVGLISLGVDLIVQRSFAPLDADYRFTGVMTANFQAMNLVVCLLCGFTLLQARPGWTRWLGPLLVLFGALLLLTRARVGTFLCLGMVAVMLNRMARQRLRPETRALVLLAGLLAVAIGIGVAAMRSGGQALTEVLMMGRRDTQNTASLSNRAPLWAELIDSVREHPLLGFGYQAFWSADRVERISSDQGWMVPHAHNTYLDETLSLGLVGAILYTGLVLGGCAVGWRRYRRAPGEDSLLIALLLTWLALLGLSESIPLAPNLPTLIAYVCLAKLFLVEGSDRLPDPVLRAGQVVQDSSALPGARRDALAGEGERL